MPDDVKRAPGVYVEPLPTGPAPIRSAATSVLALIAITAKAIEVPDNTPDDQMKPSVQVGGSRLLQSMEALNRYLGALQEENREFFFWPSAAVGYFANGGRNIYFIEIKRIVKKKESNKTEWKELVKKALEQEDKAIDHALAKIKLLPDVTIVAFPDAVHLKQEKDKEWALDAQRKMIRHCKEMQDRVAALDIPEKYLGDASKWRNGIETGKAEGNPKAEDDLDDEVLSYAALYYPWLKTNSDRFVPPSGHVAGVIARVDAGRGVHKAPANELIAEVFDLSHITSAEGQAALNDLGVNCIRAFPGDGIRVWGARTLAGNDTWRYINVRRLVCSITDSVLQSIRWAVFEPNGPILWAALRRDVTAYLREKWQEGALVGRTPDQAFFVKCDETNNPDESIKKGECRIDIGIAPARPAEFVVFRIGQWDGGARITTLSE